jgi:hypothetical protein
MNAVLNVVDSITSGIGTFGDRRLDAPPVVWMYTGDKYSVIDMRFWRQAPHCLHAGIPVESIGLWIPGIAAQTNKIDCSLQPCFTFAQSLLRDPADNHVRSLVGIEVGESQIAIGRSAWAPKMCGQHADRLAAPTVDERRRLYRAKPC